MPRLDEKLARIHAGKYSAGDFILADAKDPDMGPGLWALGPKRENGRETGRFRTRAEFLDEIRAIVAQDLVDVMLVSLSNLEALTATGTFAGSKVKPVIRANDTTDIWRARGARYHEKPSRPFRTADLAEVAKFTDLGLYSVTFNDDLDADVASLDAYRAFRAEARAQGVRHFLEVFNPNVPVGFPPEALGAYVNDCIARCLAGLTRAERPLFLKIAYNGPRAMEELCSYDPSLVVGVLGGGAGTTRDCFELIRQAETHGARVALFGRKINLAESPLDMVRHMRLVADRSMSPSEAVRSYHSALAKAGISPLRAPGDDDAVTEPALKLG
ncbi:MAG: hypothetical protein KGI57_03155 [Hyphomicrobiales bacterium]|nr:hypothetical protein [Hyphomicrobiales bacterium]MDE2016686.1 hypothetical protein [Hyphomicrobiales bacterium]